jgi:hypothetical protein
LSWLFKLDVTSAMINQDNSSLQVNAPPMNIKSNLSRFRVYSLPRVVRNVQPTRYSFH